MPGMGTSVKSIQLLYISRHHMLATLVIDVNKETGSILFLTINSIRNHTLHNVYNSILVISL